MRVRVKPPLRLSSRLKSLGAELKPSRDWSHRGKRRFPLHKHWRKSFLASFFNEAASEAGLYAVRRRFLDKLEANASSLSAFAKSRADGPRPAAILVRIDAHLTRNDVAAADKELAALPEKINHPPTVAHQSRGAARRAGRQPQARRRQRRGARGQIAPQ